MNIRLSAGSLRLRLSEEESRRLLTERMLQEHVSIPRDPLIIRIELEDGLTQTLDFSLHGALALMKVRTEDYLSLLASKPTKDSGLRQVIGSAAESLCLQLEIDLFTLKAKNRRKEQADG